jgi:hypothetical protein
MIIREGLYMAITNYRKFVLGSVLVAMTALYAAAIGNAGVGEKSKAVEKDGVALTISVANQRIHADGQPFFEIRFENKSRDYINFYDADACWKWQFVLTKLDAAEGAPAIWKLKFDVNSQAHALAHKQAKSGETCATIIDLANDPPFTFTYVGELERKKSLSLRHLKPGKYEAKATVSLEAPFGKGYHHWTGPLTTEPVQFTVLDSKQRAEPSKKDLAAYDKALKPVLRLTEQVGGLWMNGHFPDIKLAKAADPEDVIAAVVNVNRSNLGTKAYHVLLVKRLKEEDGKRFLALISVGKATKALLCFPIFEDRWWSRSYDATIESVDPPEP